MKWKEKKRKEKKRKEKKRKEKKDRHVFRLYDPGVRFALPHPAVVCSIFVPVLP